MTLLVLVLLSVTIISLDESGRAGSLTSGLRSVAHDVYSPLQSGVNDITRPIGNFFAGGVNYGSLQQQNQKLEFQLGQLKQQQAQTPAAITAYQQLSALSNLTSVYNINRVFAQTVSVNPSNFASTINIDKGRSQGVQVGDPVVGAGGLVGHVSEASHNAAIVTLITDGTSKVGVTFQGNSIQNAPTVNGQGSGDPLNVALVNPGTSLTMGTHLVTSGLEGATYPSGIPVAYVTAVHTVAGSNQESVLAQPMANLHQLAYVVVLQWTPSPATP